MSSWKTDTRALSEQYADATNLNARVALHKRFSTSSIDLQEWVFRRIDVPDGSRILTLGCGDGDIWKAVTPAIPQTWNLVLTDVSAGMVHEARQNLAVNDPTVTVAQVDAATVPFSEATFEAVTANHMLYHVPNPKKALEEIARVLKPHGTVYATTSGEGHMAELLDVVRACTGVHAEGATSFTLENGSEQLERVFDSVNCYHYEDSLRVTQIEPLVAYALSRPGFREEHVKEFVDLIHDVRENGVFHITKNVGLFGATHPL